MGDSFQHIFQKLLLSRFPCGVICRTVLYVQAVAGRVGLGSRHFGFLAPTVGGRPQQQVGEQSLLGWQIVMYSGPVVYIWLTDVDGGMIREGVVRILREW